jgi:hypothetical protein
LTTFKDLYSELNGLLKSLSISFCKKIVNNALQSIYDESDWSFLLKHGYIIIPSSIKSYNVGVVKYSNEITVHPDLKVILDDIEADINQPRIVNRQIRITSRDNINARIIYNINEYDSANSKLIIDNPYLGETNPNAQYVIFKSLIRPNDIVSGSLEVTSDNFKSFLYIADLKNQRKLHLDYDIDEHNIDRFPSGNSFALSSYRLNDLDEELYELYPHQNLNTDLVYRVKFYINESELINDSDKLPKVLSKNLVLTKAKILLYEYADSNKNNEALTELKGINFQNLIALQVTPANPFNYERLLVDALLKDEELLPKALIDDIYYKWPFYSLPHDRRDTLLINF